MRVIKLFSTMLHLQEIFNKGTLEGKQLVDDLINNNEQEGLISLALASRTATAIRNSDWNNSAVPKLIAWFFLRLIAFADSESDMQPLLESMLTTVAGAIKPNRQELGDPFFSLYKKIGLYSLELGRGGAQDSKKETALFSLYIMTIHAVFH
ncbi:hypothetical protein ACJX0J_023051 [Zea mays]